MDDNTKITIETLINKAVEISKISKYDYQIKDIVNLCMDFDYNYTEKLIEENELYVP